MLSFCGRHLRLLPTTCPHRLVHQQQQLQRRRSRGCLGVIPSAFAHKCPDMAALQGRKRGVGFIGAGQMAEALARGFLGKRVVELVSVNDPSEDRKELFRSFGCTPRADNLDVG